MGEVLITGIGGFAGRYLAQEAQRQGLEVVGTTRSSNLNIPNVRTFPCDLTKPENVDNLFKNVHPDLIFHFGNTVAGRHQDSTESLVSNVLTTALLVETCRKYNFKGKIIFASSVSVYGVSKNDTPITENDSPNPVNSYGLAKLYQEAILRATCPTLGYGLVITRGSNYCGPDQAGNFLPPQIAHQVIQIEQGIRDHIEVWNGAAEVDLVDIRDVTKANLLLAEKGTGIYNLSSGKPLTVESVARLMLLHSHADNNIFIASSKPKEAKRARLDSTKLRELGWDPLIAPGTSLGELLDWTRHTRS
jgi:nucleoside-diphosphate-sugar epimerase